jgi:hypothetical protein
MIMTATATDSSGNAAFDGQTAYVSVAANMTTTGLPTNTAEIVNGTTSTTSSTGAATMFAPGTAGALTVSGLTAATTASPAGNESIITTVGNNSAGLQAYGQLHELIIYSTTLSLFQRQPVEGYLAWKWGLQANLPGNHPYKLFPPSP